MNPDLCCKRGGESAESPHWFAPKDEKRTVQSDTPDNSPLRDHGDFDALYPDPASDGLLSDVSD